MRIPQIVNFQYSMVNGEWSIYLYVVSYYEIMFHNYVVYYDLEPVVKCKTCCQIRQKKRFVNFHIDLIKNHDINFIY